MTQEMSVIKNVSVIGATGGIGPFIVKALHNANFTVSVITRENPQGPPKKFDLSELPSAIQIKQSDYTHESLVEKLSGQDAVVSTIGPLGTLGQKTIIDAAIEAGVKRFIPSEYGYKTPTLPAGCIPEIGFAMKDKKEVLDHLIKNQERISWTGLGTGAFLDWAIGFNALGFNYPSRSMTIFDGGNALFTGTIGTRIGDAIAQTLLRPEQTANKFLCIRSVKTTQNEMLAAFESYTNIPWKRVEKTTDEAYAEGKELLKQGNILGARLGFVARQFFEQGNHSRGVVAEDDSEGMRLLDLADQSLEEVIEAGIAWGKKVE